MIYGWTITTIAWHTMTQVCHPLLLAWVVTPNVDVARSLEPALISETNITPRWHVRPEEGAERTYTFHTKEGHVAYLWSDMIAGPVAFLLNYSAFLIVSEGIGNKVPSLVYYAREASKSPGIKIRRRICRIGMQSEGMIREVQEAREAVPHQFLPTYDI